MLFSTACNSSDEGNAPVSKNDQDVTDPQNMTETQPPETEAKPLTAAEKRLLVKDSLPDISFDGADFRVATKENWKSEVLVDELTGDGVNDAIYDRNSRISERFKVNIVPVVTPEGDMYTQVNNVRASIMAEDDAFDLAATYAMTAGTIISEGCYRNWNDMPYNDFSQPWWLSNVNDCFGVGGKIFTVVGDMCFSLLEYTYCTYYNRTRGDTYGLTEQLFKDIREGKWTIDYLLNLTGNIYEDVNGDGERDGEDIYGFLAHDGTDLMIYTYAFDIPLTARNSEGIPELAINSEKTITAVEKINKLYWENNGSYIIPEANHPEVPKMFAAGKSVFYTSMFCRTFNNLRDMEDDFSILPFVKYDEAQESYLTSDMDNYSVLGVPITCKNLDLVSVVTESMNVESYRTVFPAYYEKALKGKYARDEESIEMIDMVMAGRRFDFATLYTAASDLNALNTIVQASVRSRNADFASRYISNEKVLKKKLEKIVKAFEEIP